MPLYRRLPKRGFTSLARRYVEVVRLAICSASHRRDRSRRPEAGGIVSSLALDDAS